MLEPFGVINLGMFLAGVVVIILMPGPNSLYVLSTAARLGVADGYKAAGAVFIGDAIIMLLAALGVGSLMRIYPVAFVFLQYAGAAYLVWLGLKVMRGALASNGFGGGDPHAACRENPFKRALALSLSNPKAILFFVSFFVQFVDPSKGHTGLAFLLLSCIVQVVSMAYLSLLIFGGAQVARVYGGNPTVQRMGGTLVGVAFMGFGVCLALKAAL